MAFSYLSGGTDKNKSYHQSTLVDVSRSQDCPDLQIDNLSDVKNLQGILQVIVSTVLMWVLFWQNP